MCLLFGLRFCVHEARKHLVIGVGWGTPSYPKGVIGQIARDCQHPGGNGSAPRVKCSRAPKDPYEGFLGDVLRKARITDDTERESE